MNSVVTVCSMVLVVFLGGCRAAAILESSTDSSTFTTLANTFLNESDMSTDTPIVPHVAASMGNIACTQKDVCAAALRSTIEQVECVEGICRCLYNHVYMNDTCLMKREYGDDGTPPPDKVAEEGTSNTEPPTSIPDKTTTESLKRTESTGEMSKTAEESTGEMSKVAEESTGELSKIAEESTGELSKTAEEPENPPKTMESADMKTTMDQPSTMAQTTMGQPTTMTTPPSNEEIKEAAPSNVEPVKEETTPQLNDKESMQGDQPVEMAKPTIMPKVGLLQNCTSSLQCEHIDGSCIDGTCECKEGYVINPAGYRCLKVASRVGDMCEEDIQCIGKLTDLSYCKNKMCVCKEGTVERMTGSNPAEAVCVAPSGLGESCTATIECHSGMTCDGGQCACGQGSQPADDKKTCIGNGASTAVASLVVLCLGLFSTLQLRRCT